MHLKYPLILIVILCLANCLICDIYASDSSTLTNDSPNGEESKQITRPETQKRLFKEQNQDILNTLHRAIGFVPLFIIAILGLISYFTHRRYEQDKMLLICVIKSEVVKVWSKSEVSLLKKLFPNNPTAKVATRLGRSTNTEKKKASRIGLKKSKKYLKSLGRA